MVELKKKREKLAGALGKTAWHKLIQADEWHDMSLLQSIGLWDIPN